MQIRTVSSDYYAYGVEKFPFGIIIYPYSLRSKHIRSGFDTAPDEGCLQAKFFA